MIRTRLRDRQLRRAMRALAFAAALGFIAGAMTVSAIVWNFGNVIGSREARLRVQPHPPSATARWGTLDEDEAGAPPIRRGDPVVAAHAPENPAATVPTIGRNPVADLRDRRLQIPVEGIGREALQSSFSDPRGGTRLHEAMDILAPRHTPVVAVENGRIARLFYSRAGGITVYQFDPTGEYVYYYAHLERYADGLAEGAPVERGQVLGYVGTSGNAPKDTPHLHFAIFRLSDARQWWEGTPIDPFAVLR
jgi:murein DD-endopeptidase MepM/ murein hydrolase activator NlpD